MPCGIATSTTDTHLLHEGVFHKPFPTPRAAGKRLEVSTGEKNKPHRVMSQILAIPINLYVFATTTALNNQIRTLLLV